MPAASLEKMCKRRLIQNIDGLIDVGDTPYNMIRDVLLRVENPRQLKEIEKNSPQIMGEDGEIWLKFIKCDIPNWEKRKHRPRDPKNWWKVYQNLKEKHEEEVKASENQLLAAISQQREEKKSRQLNFINEVNDPKQKKRKRQDVIPRSGNSMDQFKRESQAVAQKRTLNTPSHRLVGAGSRITHAPKSMLPDPRRLPTPRESQIPSTQPSSIYPPRKTPANQNYVVGRSNQSGLAAREQRLRAITGSAKPSTQPGPSCLQAAAANRKRKAPDKIFAPPKRRACGGSSF